jgi:hypothetical protein
MRTSKRLSDASATLGPDVTENSVKIEFAGRGLDIEGIQTKPERVQRTKDQTELGSRLSRLEVGKPATTHSGRSSKLRLSLTSILPGLPDNQTEVARVGDSHPAPSCARTYTP